MATIALTVTAVPTVTSTGVRVQLEVRNSGDTAARNVMPILAFRGNETLGTFEPSLDPGRASMQTIVIPLESADRERGTWPIFCRVAYADANNHAFEAVHVMTVGFSAADTKAVPVSADVTGARFAVSGQAHVRLRSTIRTDASLTFVVPTGVAVTPDHASVFLEPGTRTVAAVVTNAGATPSSRLPLFAVTEFNVGGEHGTVIGAGMLDIAADEQLPPWILPAVTAALIVVWVVVVVFRRRARPAR
jgi:hypothetical protein